MTAAASSRCWALTAASLPLICACVVVASLFGTTLTRICIIEWMMQSTQNVEPGVASTVTLNVGEPSGAPEFTTAVPL